MLASIDVLYVEDNEGDFHLVKIQLSQHSEYANYSVRWASSLKAALVAKPPDIVLTDLGLSPWNDRDVLQSLKDVFTLTPLVVLSGALPPEKELRLLEMGADDALPKDEIERLPRVLSKSYWRMDGARKAFERSLIRVDKMMEALK